MRWAIGQGVYPAKWRQHTGLLDAGAEDMKMIDARTGELFKLDGRPVALDLCCGKGGWTNGLLKAGYQVIGIDIDDMGGYEGFLLLADVKTFDTCIFKGLKFSLVVASPPCQEFSYRSFPFKKCKNLPPPSKEIWHNCERIARELNCPLVLENVRGAQPYMGRAAAHYGSFYLWGDVPALLPIGRPKKGFKNDRNNKNWQGNCQANGKKFGWNAEAIQEGRNTKARDSFHGGIERGQKGMGYKKFKDMPHSQTGSKSSARKEWSAKIAMIPIELSEWIGQCFK